ncbi:unnamed protein product [Rotaria sp. Silwood1]|nr:unnamed protein product [Rotaria sp. Silwood1]CAF1340245.1 unnamed protein product [Rotaria sp. Silwood1]CAF3552348.1 unnamed protein product [Rotaria sp. Silwood1]CAF4659065.1 unnamed protein product [Rotaria sp. Silwood1]
MVQTRRRKRGKVYLHEINRKRLWSKEKRKREVRVRHCPLIRSNWESKLSVPTNYHEFALVHDIKKSFPIPKTKDLLNPKILEKYIKEKEENSDNDIPSVPMIDSTKQKKKRRPTKVHIRDELEKDANTERVKSLRISDPDRLFCIYMIEKHDTNYEAMARDHHNDYQLTARQLERKIEKFKKIPKVYERYLAEKAEGKNFLAEFQMDD